MKILHATFLHGYNFGGALQALAVQTLLVERGHEVWSLDLPTARRKLLIRKITSNSELLNRWAEKNLDHLSFSNVNEFELFRSRYFRYTRPFHSFKQVREITRGYDAYVVGSDQVWRNGWRRAHFLADLSSEPNLCRIAIAACVGQFSSETEWADWEQMAIRRFDALSVRNEFTRDAIARYFEHAIHVVCDPTVACDLPLETYDIPEKKYVLFYISNRDARSMDLARQVLSEVKNNLEDRIISIPPSEMKGRETLAVDQVVSAINPLQWSYLISRSNFVITNSFHGVVFSVLSHRPFIALETSPATGARARNFLSQMGLVSQVASSSFEAMRALESAKYIDWDNVDKRLRRQRQNFNAFLDSALALVP